MAGNNIKGLTIEIGANTKELDAAFGDLNKKANTLQRELKEVDKGLKFNPKDTELLAQKQKILGEQVANTKDKLDKLRDAEKKVQDQFQKGEISEEKYRAFKREIVDTESKLNKYTEQLKEATRNQDAFSAKIKESGDKLKDFGGKIQGIGQTMATSVTLPIVGAGAVAFKFAADLEDSMGASDQIFKGSAKEVQAWANNLASYYGIAETDALTYTNTMGAMLQNIGGLSEEEAAKQSQMLVMLAGDLTAMFGGTTEQAVQAITGSLKGNNGMLDNYGMGVNDATIKTKAFEMGLIKEGEQLTLAQRQQATLALIMEQTADAQGQASREAEGASGTLRSLTTELKNVGTEIGQVLLPILTPFVARIKEVVEKFKAMSPETKELIVKIALFAAAIGPVLIVVGMMASAIGSIMGLFGALSAAAGVAGISIGAIVAPIGIAIAAVAAIIAIFVALYNNWDSIKEGAAALGQSIKDTFGNIAKWISDKMASAMNAVTNAIQGIKNAFNFQFQWPKLKMPKFAITGSMNPLKWLELGVPKLSVNWNADGAIFTKPYIFGNQGLGEAGPEAVLPISKLAGILADTMSKMGTQQQPAMAGVTYNHTGTIRVEGVNSRGEMMDVVNIVMDELRREVRR